MKYINYMPINIKIFYVYKIGIESTYFICSFYVLAV